MCKYPGATVRFDASSQCPAWPPRYQRSEESETRSLKIAFRQTEESKSCPTAIRLPTLGFVAGAGFSPPQSRQSSLGLPLLKTKQTTRGQDGAVACDRDSHYIKKKHRNGIPLNILKPYDVNRTGGPERHSRTLNPELYIPNLCHSHWVCGSSCSSGRESSCKRSFSSKGCRHNKDTNKDF